VCVCACAGSERQHLQASVVAPLHSDEVAFVQRCGNRHPEQLNQEERLFAAALCVAELAGVVNIPKTFLVLGPT
jgi:hypothetical protein